MNYLIAAQSDVGIVKKTNQDSYCIFTAKNTEIYFSLLFATEWAVWKRANLRAQLLLKDFQIGLKRHSLF